MQDDFGEFLQAPPITAAEKPAHGRPYSSKMAKDLDSKIMESFDLSGSSQKASFKFQQPSRNVGKRPTSVQYKQSSSSADWKSLDLKTSEFTARVKHFPQGQQKSANPMPQYGSGAYGIQMHPKSNIRQKFTQPAQPVGNLGYISPSTLQNQTNFPAQAIMQTQGVPLRRPGNFQGSRAIKQISHNQGQIFGVQNTTGIQGGTVIKQPAFGLPTNTMTNWAVGNAEQLSQQGSKFGLPIQNRNNLQMNYNSSVSPFQQNTIIERTNRDLTLPSWMTRPSEIPPLYKEVLKLCATPNSFADTARLYPIFVSSQLPKDVLGHIWSAANQSTPGQLTFSEVYIALALIALAQRGEMNLTVSYVTKLKSPPIPNLQLPSANVTSSTMHAESQRPSNSSCLHMQQNVPQPLSSQTVQQNLSLLKPVPNLPFDPSANQSIHDDFADFQSVSPSSTKASTAFDNANDQTEFEDFRSYVPFPESSENFPAGISYPDRNLINSPRTRHENETATVAPPKPLLSSIDFSKFKSDSTKSLHNAAKSLTIIPNSNSMPSLSPNATKYSEFSEFKISAAASTGNQKIGPGVFPPKSSPIIGNISKPDDFAEFKAAPLVHPVKNQGDPPLFSSAFVPGTPKRKVDSLLDIGEGQQDKYSALRDMISAVPTSKPDLMNSDLEFADFQSVPHVSISSLATTGLNTDSLGSQTGNSASPSIQSFFGKTSGYKEDSLSVSSLELPSLSKTISSLSIGSSSPSQPADDLYSVTSQDKPDAFGDFTTFTPTTTPLPMVMSSATSHIEQPHLQDDGLYDLDEPISPLAGRKFRNNEKSAVEKPPSPPKVKRFVVPRRISEADSDFGDFSSAPPPIDDLDDSHHGEFGGNEGGTSSLVDFDAFRHFEEAKEETRMKKEAMFNQKRSKEDATAFSEFVKSSIVDLKPSHEVNDPSHPDFVTEEESSAFGSEAPVRSEKSNEAAIPPDEQLTVELHVQDGNNGDSVSTTWRLDSTISDSETIEESEKSKWDEEGEELKARMEGSTNHNHMELYAEHWARCLATCMDIIVSTGEIFAALDSPAVCHEIVNSTRGNEFISCTSEVYGVARRIRKGMESVGLLDEDLEAALKEIEIAWNNLLGFCPYTPSVHKTPEHCCVKDSNGGRDERNDSSACSLCLLSTNGSIPIGLKYGGKSYHAPCANLWLNQIAPILPRLELPPVS